MLKFTQLATSVLLALIGMAFIGLWIRSFYFYRMDGGMGPSYLCSERELAIFSDRGCMDFGLLDVSMDTPRSRRSFGSRELHPSEKLLERANWRFKAVDRSEWQFGFPTWLPGVISVLLAIVVLRFDRRFSVRSAMLAMTAVAVLLGMIVASRQGM